MMIYANKLYYIIISYLFEFCIDKIFNYMLLDKLVKDDKETMHKNIKHLTYKKYMLSYTI